LKTELGTHPLEKVSAKEDLGVLIDSEKKLK